MSLATFLLIETRHIFANVLLWLCGVLIVVGLFVFKWYLIKRDQR
ncbi:MAG TPA: hypothetical protein VIK91_07180 [Nannocystis sp.]